MAGQVGVTGVRCGASPAAILPLDFASNGQLSANFYKWADEEQTKGRQP
jgi:hypothetical protein